MKVSIKGKKKKQTNKKKKTKIKVSGPVTSWQIEGEKVETVTDFIFLGCKITMTVTAVMKLKDALVPLHFLPLECITHISEVVDVCPTCLDTSL